MSTPVSTTSLIAARRPARAPARRSRRSARERLGPRPNGMMQKVQRWSQPCCTWTKARARPANSVDQMRRGLARRHDVGRPRAGASGAQLSGLQLLGVAEHAVDLGQRGAARRVDLRGAAGDDDARVRAARGAARRIAWRAWRSASAVTAQVLTMMVSVEPAAGVAAHHLALVGVEPAAEGEDLDASCRDRPRGRCAPVKAVATGPVISTWPSVAPFDLQLAAVEHDRRRGARSGRGGAAFTSAAQAPEPQASVRPAPRSQTRRRMRSGAEHLGEADIGALGKQRVVLERAGRASPTGTASTSATKNVACGLPMLAAAGSASGPAREVEMQRVHRPRPAGCRASRAAPAPCRPRPGRRRSDLGRQVAGDGRDAPGARRPVSRASRSATQRVALPQAPASLPSGLRMRMKASAPALAAAARSR